MTGRNEATGGKARIGSQKRSDSKSCASLSSHLGTRKERDDEFCGLSEFSFIRSGELTCW